LGIQLVFKFPECIALKILAFSKLAVESGGVVEVTKYGQWHTNEECPAPWQLEHLPFKP
jgi:hypothetical protein